MVKQQAAEQTKAMDGLRTERFVKLTHGRNAVADPFRAFARQLSDAQGLELDVEKVLFLTDTESEDENGSVVGRVPRIWSDIIWQYTGYRFIFYVKLHMAALRALSKEKKMAAIYHELRHLARNGDGEPTLLRRHDVEEWAELASCGDWKHTDAPVPDLLSKRAPQEAPKLAIVPAAQNNNEEAIA